MSYASIIRIDLSIVYTVCLYVCLDVCIYIYYLSHIYTCTGAGSVWIFPINQQCGLYYSMTPTIHSVSSV